MKWHLTHITKTLTLVRIQHMPIHHIELHAEETHDAFADVSEIGESGDMLHPLVKSLKRETPETAQRAETQDVGPQVICEMVLGLVES